MELPHGTTPVVAHSTEYNVNDPLWVLQQSSPDHSILGFIQIAMQVALLMNGSWLILKIPVSLSIPWDSQCKSGYSHPIFWPVEQTALKGVHFLG